MKKYFITGLVILLPLALTVAIVVFIFNFLTEPFAGIVKSILNHYGWLTSGLLFWSADQVQQAISQLIILLFLFFFTVGLGIITRWFFFNYLINLSERLFHRIPFISSVYKTCKDVIKTIFTSKTKSFKQVVLVRFPNQQTQTIGLVTRENIPGIRSDDQELVAVFVPTTPNPTSGFLMMFKQNQLTYLDMTIEDAFKYVISCGVILTPLNELTKEQADKLNQQNENQEEIENLREPIE